MYTSALFLAVLPLPQSQGVQKDAPLLGLGELFLESFGFSKGA